MWVGVRTPGTELPERADRIRAALAQAPLVEATDAPRRGAARGPRPRAARLPRPAHGTEWEAGLTATRARTASSRTCSPTPAWLGRLGARRPRPPRAPGQFAYDTMTLIGPGTYEAARAAVDVGADRRRPGARRRAAPPTPLPPARPPRRPARLRRLLLPQQRRGGGRSTCATAARPRRRASTSTPTTATAPRRSSDGEPDRPHRLGARRPRRRLVPALPRLRRRDAAGAGEGANLQPAARPRHRRRPLARGVAELLAEWAARAGPRPGRRARASTPRRGDPESPLEVTAGRLPRRGPRASARSACRPSSCRRAATTWTRSATSCSRRSTASRRRRMAERPMWVGTRRARGRARAAAQGRRAAAALAPRRRRRHRAPALPDARRRPHDRALHRGRATPPTCGPARRRNRARRERLTTGRAPVPYWEDDAPAPLPRRRRPSPTPTTGTSGSSRRTAARRGSCWRRAARSWIDAARLIVSVERERHHPARRRRPRPTRGRGGSPRSDDTRRRGRGGRLPRRQRGRVHVLCPTTTSTVPRSASRTSPPARPAPSPARGACTTAARLVARREHDRLLLRAQRLLRAAPRRRRRRRRPAADHGGRRPLRARVAPGRRAPRRRPRPPQPLDLVVVDAASGERDGPRRGRRRGAARTGPPTGDVVATYEDHATPPELRSSRQAQPRTLRARAAAVKRAPPRRRPRRSRSRPSTAWRSRRSSTARRRVGRAPCLRSSTPTAARPTPYGDEWDGHAQYFVDKGYAWLAPNFRGCTCYGRDFERAQPRRLGRRRHHGLPRRRTTTCARSTGSTASGSRSSAASYGSYMALLRGHRRPGAPLPLRGDQVRRLRHPDLVGTGRPRRRPGPGADDGPPVDRPRGLPRRLAHPPASRTSRFRSWSPTASSTSASARSSPQQLVAELRRLGKTFEYVTYPTEGHGFLRAGPQV